jgi:hypothetical protein
VLILIFLVLCLVFLVLSPSLPPLFQQNGLAKKREGSRKQIKEKKNRAKKVWGLGRRLARHKAKKAESS